METNETRKRLSDKGISGNNLTCANGSGALGVASELKPWPFSFPRDHGAHPEFETEWWYLSGNLTSSRGGDWGYQFTVFRHRPALRIGRLFALKAPFDGFASHLVITMCENKTFHFLERHGSHLMGTAEALAGELDVRVQDWSLKADGERMHLLAQEQSCGINLELRPQKAPVLNGHKGFSLKASSPEGSSHHYSISNMDTCGTITWGEQIHQVKGRSWLDREFGSQIFPSTVQGWDWFSLWLDNGFEIMLVKVRSRTTASLAAAYGTLICPDGISEYLGENDFRSDASGSWKSPVSGADYPMGWLLHLPSRQIELEVKPIVENHEINSVPYWKVDYWEGPVRVRGKMMNETVSGQGYVELTGYSQALGGRF